jgi:hypothetical protein
MSYLFYYVNEIFEDDMYGPPNDKYMEIDFNENINVWDVSNVENMEGMFEGCFKFNKPLDKWNVSKVKNIPKKMNKKLF